MVDFSPLLDIIPIITGIAILGIIGELLIEMADSLGRKLR